MIKKFLTGTYTLKIREKYILIPKIAPVMFVSLPLMGLNKEGSLLFWVGTGLFIISAISFYSSLFRR